MKYEHNLHILKRYECLSQRKGLMLYQLWEKLFLLVLVVKNVLELFPAELLQKSMMLSLFLNKMFYFPED